MARARHADPLACLHRLLDRHEDRAAAVEAPEGDAPEAGPGSVLAEFVNQSFPDVREETEFRRVILAAEASGAVRLEMDRGDLSHVMKRVVLTDPARLCVFLSRTPRASQVDGVRGRLAAGISDLPPGPPQARAREALERLAEAWRRGEPRHRLEPWAEAEALRFLRAWGWASTKSETDDRDLRSYSRQVAGDSKLIERQLGRILAEARETGLLPLELETDEAVAALGLGKFPHLVQIGIDAGAHAAAYRNGHHVGIHPGELEALPRQRLAYLMTVENYASFNRMIREVRDPAAAIVYTGGWPAPGVRRAIAVLAPLADQVLHWGDIDMAGAAIADCVWRAAGGEIKLHLMSPDEPGSRPAPRRRRASAPDLGSSRVPGGLARGLALGFGRARGGTGGSRPAFAAGPCRNAGPERGGPGAGRCSHADQGNAYRGSVSHRPRHLSGRARRRNRSSGCNEGARPAMTVGGRGKAQGFNGSVDTRRGYGAWSLLK
jgi:hypothetical protein